MAKYIDIIGQTFNFLEVLERVPAPLHIKNPKDNSFWLCKCLYKNCGQTKIICRNDLKDTYSCGCFGKEAKSHDNILGAKIASAKNIYSNKYNKDGLSFEEFYQLSQKQCYYCGLQSELSNCYNRHTENIKWTSDFAITNGHFKYNGLDRVDNTKGHMVDNLVPCCWICNRYKNNLNQFEFYQQINNLNPIPIIDIIKIDHHLKLQILFPFKTVNQKENRNLLLSKIRGYRNGSSKSRNLEYNLTNHQAAEFLISPCAYCNKAAMPKQGILNGIDRLDNTKGYLLDNCVPACFNCNCGKGEMSMSEFLSWIIRTKTFNQLISSPNNVNETLFVSV